ncbi:MAG: acyl-CoA dehydrogenase family protein [Bdellovibrionales bacterium]|nr:acyl-CoA dehydrogenase family protein [Bdellovibrionales bacterium]
MTWQDGTNFGLNDDDIAIRDMARAFAREKVYPLAEKIDAEHYFPRELLPEMASLGFLGAMVPESLGGSELSQVQYCILIEELAAACASTSIIVSAHNSLCVFPIVEYGTQAQREEFAKPLASGEALGCFALSEPGTGSDAAALTCKYERTDKGFVVRGAKNWITNGPEADVCVLFATNDTSSGYKGVSAFVHSLHLDGISRGRPENKLGICGSPTCALQYDEVELPATALLGEEGRGFNVAMGTLNGGRTGVAAQAVGIARGALEHALAYSKERKAFGSAICDHQSIKNYLADMVNRVDAARLLTHSAAFKKDQGLRYSREAAMAKLFASEAATWVANKALQIYGGYGYVKDYPAERHLRDAKITEIYEGTSEIQRLVVADTLLKESEG